MPERIRANRPIEVPIMLGPTFTAEQKVRRFILFYHKEPNGTRAARLAGYNGNNKVVGVQATRLLAQPSIRQELVRLRERAAEKTQVSVEKLLAELGKLAFSNMSDYIRIDPEGNPHIDLSELTADEWSAIEEVTTETYMEGSGDYAREVKRVKIKLHSKLGAIEKAGKHLGMFDRRRGSDDPEQDPETVHYTLNIGNARISLSPQDRGTVLIGKAISEPDDEGEG